MKRIEKKNIKLNENELINYQRLNTIMLEIEKIVIEQEELDYVEQKLLYDVLLDRRNDRINAIKMQDGIGKVEVGSLMKKLMGK